MLTVGSLFSGIGGFRFRLTTGRNGDQMAMRERSMVQKASHQTLAGGTEV